MSGELSRHRLNIPPNSAMFDVGHLRILVMAGRMGSTFKHHSACKCAYTLLLLARHFSAFASYQRWQEIFIPPYLDIWLMNWSSVILGHLCFRGQDFTVNGQTPPLQSVWSLEQLQLHGWCFWPWTRLQSTQDPLVPGVLANNYCQILPTFVKISSVLYLGNAPCQTAPSPIVILVPYSTVYRTTHPYLLLGVWQLLFWCMSRSCFPSVETAIHNAHMMCSCGHFSSTRPLVITETKLQLKHDEPQHQADCRQRCH